MSGNFVYCGGSSLLQIRYVWKLRKSDLVKVGQDIGRLSAIDCIAEDVGFVYDSGGLVDNHVHKLRKSDLFEVAISIAYSADTNNHVYGIALDDDHVYCGGTGTQKVWKLKKSDLSKIAESVVFANIRGVVVDESFVYCGTETPDSTIYKLNKGDLSLVTSNTYADWLYSIGQDADNIYAAGGFCVRKYRKSDLAEVANTPANGIFDCVATGGDFVYSAGTSFGVNRKAMRFLKSDLSLVDSGADYEDPVRCICIDETFVYMGGDKGVLWKMRISDLVKVAESMYYDAGINAVVAEQLTPTIGGNINSSRMVGAKFI